MPNEQNPNQPTGSNPIKPSARRNARRYALQAMYQWVLSGATVSEIQHEFLNYHVEKTEPLDLDYFKELIHGVPELQQEIDNEMQPFLGRPFQDIDPIELSVLRIAIYEFIKRPDVPYRVVINEALELTKTFGSVEGHKFVNGVLDRVARKVRATEIKMKKE